MTWVKNAIILKKCKTWSNNKMNQETKEAHKDSRPNKSVIRVLSILDFILRVVGAIGTLASAIAMGTTRQTLPFVTSSLRFKAVYKDLPTFTFFVIANSVVCGYLVVSLCLSFFNIVKISAVKTRTVLIIFDMVMMGLLTSGASSSAAIIYIARNGNTGANWPAFCQQFNSFCERVSGSLIGSFVSVIVLMLITITISIVISFR